MTEFLTIGSFIGWVAAVLFGGWEKLRAERYRKRWREARAVLTGGSSEWRLALQNSNHGSKHWCAVNGDHKFDISDAHFGYPRLAAEARENAEQIVKELNTGTFEVVS